MPRAQAAYQAAAAARAKLSALGMLFAGGDGEFVDAKAAAESAEAAEVAAAAAVERDEHGNVMQTEEDVNEEVAEARAEVEAK